MPLSDPAPREALHTRTIEMRGYIREDGLWDIEGHITDTKTYSFENEWRGKVGPGVPVHEMHVRLTIDDDKLIHACEAVYDHFPFPTCPGAAPNFEALKGIKIGPGWMREVRRVVGGTSGCTHIVEMLAQMGTVAYQTHVAKERVRGPKSAGKGGAKRRVRPALIDTCYALASDGMVVEKWMPDWYTGTKKAVAEGD
jgi:hypothetical protein